MQRCHYAIIQSFLSHELRLFHSRPIDARAPRLIPVQDITRAILYSLRCVLDGSAVEAKVASISVLLSAISASGKNTSHALAIISETKAVRVLSVAPRLVHQALCRLSHVVPVNAMCGWAEMCVVAILLGALPLVRCRLFELVNALVNALLYLCSAGSKVLAIAVLLSA